MAVESWRILPGKAVTSIQLSKGHASSSQPNQHTRIITHPLKTGERTVPIIHVVKLIHTKTTILRVDLIGISKCINFDFFIFKI